MKPKLNKNLSLPWTPQGEKVSENHQILSPREKATSLISPIKVNMIPLSGFLVSILWPHWPCYCDRYIITVISTSTSFHLSESKGWQLKNNIFTKQKHMKPKWPTSIFDTLLPRLSIFLAKMYIFLVSPHQKPCSRWLNTLGK